MDLGLTRPLAALTLFVFNSQLALPSVIDCLGPNSRVQFNKIREFHSFIITLLLLGLLAAGLIGVELSILSPRLAGYIVISPYEYPGTVHCHYVIFSKTITFTNQCITICCPPTWPSSSPKADPSPSVKVPHTHPCPSPMKFDSGQGRFSKLRPCLTSVILIFLCCPLCPVVLGFRNTRNRCHGQSQNRRKLDRVIALTGMKQVSAPPCHIRPYLLENSGSRPLSHR